MTNKKSRINLIEVRATEEGVGAGSRSHEPIGISVIGGYLEKRGIASRIICPTLKNPYVSPERVLDGSPDYVGISCFMNDLGDVKDFANQLKERSPKTKIIVGGNGVLTEPSEISKHQSIDLVIKGEGAYPLEDIINNNPRVRGLVFQNGVIIHNNPTRMNLKEAGIPLRDEEMMEGRKRLDLTNPAPTNQRFAATYTSAGCNNHCSFCQTSEMFPGGIKFRDPRAVLKEVKECQEKYGINYMLLMDPVAFGGVEGFKSGHAEQCAELLQNIDTKFYALTRLDMPEEYWDILKKAGVSKVGVGIESLIQEGIKDGTPEIQIERINEYARNAIERGILCRGLFMAGYEGQTVKDIEREIEGIKQLENVTDIRVGWYNPFEKTQAEIEEMYARGEVYTADISKRDTSFPIFKIQGVSSPSEAQELKTSMYQAFFNSENVDKSAKKIVNVDPTLKQSYDEFNVDVLSEIGCEIKYS